MDIGLEIPGCPSVKNILFVHHSADLYGSDKVLLDITRKIDRTRFYPIVLLPGDGPLVQELKNADIEMHLGPILNIGRASLSVAGLFHLPIRARQAARHIDMLVQNRPIALVHSNTLAVLGGALWAKLRRVPHLWHVHEIIPSPRVVRKGFPKLADRCSALIICNSNATRDWIVSSAPKTEKRTRVIWNGIEPVNNTGFPDVGELRTSFGLKQDKVVIALVGRINRWKGHRLLLEAASLLARRGCQNFQLVFAGGVVVGQEHLKRNLLATIRQVGLLQHVVLLDYLHDIYNLWSTVDIGVVPSTEPEPFGMVAIEAMALGKPVVAADWGGLSDIVIDGQTGLLFKPKCAESLAEALYRIILDPALRIRLGESARTRQRSLFTIERQVDELQRCYSAILGT